MLCRIANANTRHFSLEDVSADGMRGYLVPKMGIRNTHRRIDVVLYGDGVLRIGTIQVNTRVIVSDIRMVRITATAVNERGERGMIGVNIDLHTSGLSDRACVYFEYDYNVARQNPLYFVRDRGHAPIHKLKFFSQLSWGQRIAKIWSWAYPCVSV